MLRGYPNARSAVAQIEDDDDERMPVYVLPQKLVFPPAEDADMG